MTLSWRRGTVAAPHAGKAEADGDGTCDGGGDRRRRPALGKSMAVARAWRRRGAARREGREGEGMAGVEREKKGIREKRGKKKGKKNYGLRVVSGLVNGSGFIRA